MRPAAAMAMSSGMSVRTRQPKEPTIWMPRRTSRVMPIGATASMGATPITTTRPPSLAIWNACVTVSGRPMASIATSTPRPDVSAWSCATGSELRASIVSVAPSARAASSFSCRTSTATICLAPNTRAREMTLDPTPPAPITATDCPSRSCAAFLIAPYAVMSAHPRMHDSSSGRTSGSAKMSVTGTTA